MSEPKAHDDFEKVLARQLTAIHARNLQWAAGDWRRGGGSDCPFSLRVRTGDLSAMELEHVRGCTYCSSIHRQPLKPRLRQLMLQRLREYGHTVLVWAGWKQVQSWGTPRPAIAGFLSVLAALAVSVCGVHYWQSRQRPSTTKAVPRTSNTSSSLMPVAHATAPPAEPETKEQKKAREKEAYLRSLPRPKEMLLRLGSPKLAGTFQDLERTMSAYIRPDTPEWERISNAWLEMLRRAGNGGFVETAPGQLVIAPRVAPDQLVEIIERQALLTSYVNGEALKELTQIQAAYAGRKSSKPLSQSARRQIGAAILKEATIQLEEAAETSVGQKAALALARRRSQPLVANR